MGGTSDERVGGEAKLRNVTGVRHLGAIVQANLQSPRRVKDGLVFGAELCNQVLCETGEAGWSNRRIGRHLGRSDMVVARCWQQWITEGRVYRRGGHPVPSRETIRRRLTEVGLRSRRPLRRLPLTPHHRQCRLDFCRPRATWSVTDWRRVIFSDESRFSLSADDHRTRVWRRTGQRSDPAFIVERHTAIS
ncbi:HTH_Tnp_Tc3_2 domain-containing protein [Trichonephila clavipes]|nr:HTH_Tnp_Tc3_2 domain-containing protein [Trichonephila clavipes]